MYKQMERLARIMAILGGAVLGVLILLTCASILGRLLNSAFHSAFMTGIAPEFSHWMIEMGVGPVNGDFELVEAGVAFAIFCFLPFCQITAGHASVDILTNAFSQGVNRFLRMVTEIVFAGVLILIAWKLADGMLSKRSYGETTLLLEFPIWWAYALSFLASAAAAVVGCYMAGVRIVEFFTGRIIVWEGMESGH